MDVVAGDFVAGYQAALHDIGGARSYDRWAIIDRDVESAALSHLDDDLWLDREIERLEIEHPVRREPIPWPPRPGRVYFMQDATGRIKIGYTSTEVERRRRAIESTIGAPVRLLACYPGTRALEKALHKKFAALRLLGEWFSDSPDVHRYIASQQK